MTAAEPLDPELFARIISQIWRCPKCERTYPEYVNGCPEDHEPPVSVELVMEVQR